MGFCSHFCDYVRRIVQYGSYDYTKITNENYVKALKIRRILGVFFIFVFLGLVAFMVYESLQKDLTATTFALIGISFLLSVIFFYVGLIYCYNSIQKNDPYYKTNQLPVNEVDPTMQPPPSLIRPRTMLLSETETRSQRLRLPYELRPQILTPQLGIRITESSQTSTRTRRRSQSESHTVSSFARNLGLSASRYFSQWRTRSDPVDTLDVRREAAPQDTFSAWTYLVPPSI